MGRRRAMPDLKVEALPAGHPSGYVGLVEPRDRSWTLFVRPDGSPVLVERKKPR